MPGEWSKEVGEYGEKVVSRLLNLIGWNPFKHPVVVPCHRDDLHKMATNQHGLDYLKYYDCPLYSFTQKTIAISAKFYETYPNDPTEMTKKFLIDLGKIMHCLKLDKELGKFKMNKDLREIQIRGLLFYLNHKSDKEESILNNLKKFRNTEPVIYEPIFVIDNKLATFLYSAITDFMKNNPGLDVHFSYPRTEQNLNGFNKLTSGRVLPIELLIANILPLRAYKNEKKILYLYINEIFSKSSLSILIGFCHEYTSGWANEIIILFNEYRELHNKKEVSEIFSKYSDGKFTKDIIIKSFPLIDFRVLEEN